nr:MAG TPA: hypothetical protein [Caudoviricetes sp.]
MIPFVCGYSADILRTWELPSIDFIYNLSVIIGITPFNKIDFLRKICYNF